MLWSAQGVVRGRVMPTVIIYPFGRTGTFQAGVVSKTNEVTLWSVADGGRIGLVVGEGAARALALGGSVGEVALPAP